jgi:hypothetical protein
MADAQTARAAYSKRYTSFVIFYLYTVRYKEVADDDMPPVIGSIYVQKSFADESKNIEFVITKKG